MSGRDLARALVGQRAGLPVIIVSGYTQDALRGGEAVAPPSKPFTSGELRQKVGDVLRRGRRADPAGGPPDVSYSTRKPADPIVPGASA